MLKLVWVFAGVMSLILAVISGLGMMCVLLHDGDRGMAGMLAIAFVATGSACGVCFIEAFDE